jgi:hypothetical protein
VDRETIRPRRTFARLGPPADTCHVSHGSISSALPSPVLAPAREPGNHSTGTTNSRFERRPPTSTSSAPTCLALPPQQYALTSARRTGGRYEDSLSRTFGRPHLEETYRPSERTWMQARERRRKSTFCWRRPVCIFFSSLFNLTVPNTRRNRRPHLYATDQRFGWSEERGKFAAQKTC